MFRPQRPGRPVPPPELTRKLFRELRAPRMGVANPTLMNNVMWTWMIQTPNAFTDHLGAGMGLPSARDAGPCWCFERMGRTSTTLSDGSVVHIAGEYDDAYHPDFFIYNDVVVVRPDGDIVIYGYAPEDFPPTDFHTATLIDGAIVLIGCLGYPEQRQFGSTQVRVLSLDTFAIRKIEMIGECPGWINHHRAVLAEDGKSIRVSGGRIHLGLDGFDYDNVDEWELELETWRWQCTARRDWQRGRFVLANGKWNCLYEIRSALGTRHLIQSAQGKGSATAIAHIAAWVDEFEQKMGKISAEIGHVPDLDSVDSLYLPDHLARAVQSDPNAGDYNYREYKVMIGATLVRFDEDHDSISVVVEGRLAAAQFETVMQSVLDKLMLLHGGEWVLLPR